MALNTLAFDKELDEIERLLRRCSEAGSGCRDCAGRGRHGAGARGRARTADSRVDATIHLVGGRRRICEREGRIRVVVGRELSTQEIASVARGRRRKWKRLSTVLYVSLGAASASAAEAWGGRSANRGQCAQACRLPYAVVVDGSRREGLQYALSPGDLCGLDDVPELIEAGSQLLQD